LVLKALGSQLSILHSYRLVILAQSNGALPRLQTSLSRFDYASSFCIRYPVISMQLTNESKGSAAGDPYTAGDVQVRTYLLFRWHMHKHDTVCSDLGVLSSDEADSEVLSVL
jgi:hypothetical protein